MSLNHPLLLTPIKLREIELKNRMVISPMCQHAAQNGHASNWHLVHLGKFALGGAGLILTESTAVDPRGRIGINDLGIWQDSHISPLRNITDFIHDNGSMIGVQLAHAGRKAGSQPLWDGGAALPEETLINLTPAIERLGPSPKAAGPGWSLPHALNEEEIEVIINLFVAATKRAEHANFDVVELHFGHGYLVASFLSPIANQRTDQWGGSLTNRMRLSIDIAKRVRSVWPTSKPLFCRISAVDGAIGGWDLEDSLVLAKELKDVGVDLIDCSSGGLSEETRSLPVVRKPGFQVPFAEKIRNTINIATQAVGMISEPQQAEDILQNGQADLIAIGREALFNPYWPHHAEQCLQPDKSYRKWHEKHGIWLAKRAKTIDRMNQ